MDTNKKNSAQRQIENAIVMFRDGKLDCAITLAAAAEGMLPKTDEPHLRQELQPYHEELGLNHVIIWLKHAGEPFNVEIAEAEAVIVIARAITKFIAVHFQASGPMIDFVEWAVEAAHLPGGFSQISN